MCHIVACSGRHVLSVLLKMEALILGSERPGPPLRLQQTSDPSAKKWQSLMHLSKRSENSSQAPELRSRPGTVLPELLPHKRRLANQRTHDIWQVLRFWWSCSWRLQNMASCRFVSKSSPKEESWHSGQNAALHTTNPNHAHFRDRLFTPVRASAASDLPLPTTHTSHSEHQVVRD